MLGVNVQDLIPEAQRFLKEVHSDVPDRSGPRQHCYRAYGLTGVPETFFVDRQGRIVRKFPGVVNDQEEWSKAVDDTLAR